MKFCPGIGSLPTVGSVTESVPATVGPAALQPAVPAQWALLAYS